MGERSTATEDRTTERSFLELHLVPLVWAVLEEVQRYFKALLSGKIEDVMISRQEEEITSVPGKTGGQSYKQERKAQNKLCLMSYGKEQT